MAVSLVPGQIASDMLACLGLGLLLALLHDSVLFLTEKSRAFTFLLDLSAFAAAAVLLQAFAAGQSLSGIPRGYMAVAMLLGALAYHAAIAPLTEGLRFWLYWLCSRPLCLLSIILKMLGRIAWGQGKNAWELAAKKLKNQLK